MKCQVLGLTLMHYLQHCQSLSPSSKAAPVLLMALSLHPHHHYYPLRTHPNKPHSVPPIKEPCKRETLSEGFLPSSRPSQQHYSSLLELCAAQKSISRGQQIHAHILRTHSLAHDAFLATKLVFMYGKCGRLSDARFLFDEMLVKTVFAWNALIGAYASDGKACEAIELYTFMRASGLMPDACTLALVLKACGECGWLRCGKEVHGLAVRTGIVSTTFVANALITMYAKCGRFDAAKRLFEGVPEKGDVVSWNSMISSSLLHGEYHEALTLFREMHDAGVKMNSYTAVGVLQACAELLLLGLGKGVHALLLKHGREFEIYVANALVVMYARCGWMDDASRVFSEMGDKDSVSWNSVLSGFVQNGLYEDAVSFFCKMIEMGFKIDQVSIISIASALGRLGKLLNGMEIHAYGIKHGFDSELQVGNTLMDMYIKCGNVNYAEQVFNRMCDKDYISWTTAIAGYAQNSSSVEAINLFREAQEKGVKVDSMMIGSMLLACSGLHCLSLLRQIHGYAIRNKLLDRVLENTIIDVYGECGNVNDAFQVFTRIENKDVVSWTSMMSCYIRNRLLNEALNLFLQMREANIEPDAVALVSVLAASADLSSLMKGKEIHGFLTRRNLIIDGSISNSLVDMYARCGNIDNSFKIFNMVKCKDVVSWTTMINASGMHGRGMEAIGLFRSMQVVGLVPDHLTFLALLYACSHSGLINEGKIYLEDMKKVYGLEPWPEHYVCVVDLLGRSGRISEAYEFIETMPIEPTAAVWCALLGACRVHSNHEIGEIAAEKLLKLEPENPGNVVLISNVFASMGKWKEAELVRGGMKGRRMRKETACSWIEVGNEVHTFIARDTSHKDSLVIYSKLAEIIERVEREGGYVADTRFVLHDVGQEEKLKMLHGHSERLAIAFALIKIPEGSPVRITKNLRVCGDCHKFTKLVSKLFERKIVVRDANRFHHFKDGSCSCNDFW